MKPRIAILTSLTDFSPAYSLCGIILDQARAFKRHGYDYDLLCLKAFKKEDKEIAERDGLSVKYILPQTTLIDYRTDEQPRTTSEKEIGFEDQAKLHAHGDPERGTTGYIEALKDYDVVITHDLMFLSWHLCQNKAVREAIEAYPEKNWLHWIHSGPSVRPDDCCYPSTLRYEAAPESTYVFLNNSQKHDCALMLSTTRNNIAVVYNPKDPRDVFGFSEETCALIEACDLFNHDILQVYPFSTPRWVEKGVRRLMKIFSEWKKQGIRAKLVLVNAHCNSPCDQPRIEAMEAYAKKCDLDLDKDVIMTSRFGDSCSEGCRVMAEKAGSEEERKIHQRKQREWKDWRYCVPANVVRELNQISNVFVFTSETECCSLIQAEAAIGTHFMVLNRDFQPMLEFATPGVLHFEFNANDPDDEKSVYYECVAREIWAEFQNETAVVNATRARNQIYNRDWIFKNQLEPLLWKKFSSKPKAVLRKPDPVKKISTYACTKASDGSVECMEPDLTEQNFSDPVEGGPCPIYVSCTQKAKCYEMAGHCLVLDEVKVTGE